MPASALTGQERFHAAYQCIEQLEQHDRYLAAYVFGSFVRGETTEHSDLDVHVMVDEDNACAVCQHDLAMVLAGLEGLGQP